MVRRVSDIQALWRSADKKALGNDVSENREFRCWVGQFKTPVAAFLCGQRKAVPAQREWEKFNKGLVLNSSVRAERQRRWRALARITNEINEHLQEVFIKLDRSSDSVEDGSVALGSVVTSRRRIQAIQKVFEKSIESGDSDSSDDVIVGRIIISSVLAGLLLRSDHVLALFGVADQGFSKDGAGYFIDIPLKDRSGKQNGLYRWYSDPLSTLLISRNTRELAHWRERVPRSRWNQSLLTRHFRRFLSKMGVPATEAPSLNQFIAQAAEAKVVTNSPAVLGLAMGKMKSHSLPARVLKRIDGIHSSVTLDITSDVFQEPLDRLDESPDVAEPGWLREIRGALQAKERSLLTKGLAELKRQWASRQLSDLASLSLDYATFVANSRSRKGKRFTVGTIKSYVLAPITKLVFLVGEVSPAAMPLYELVDVYDEAVEACESADSKQRIVMGIVWFHRFLVARYGAEKIDIRDALGFSGGAVPVNANMITEDEYQKVWREIDRSSLSNIDPDYAIVAKLMLLFGYRLGLRRSEALWLRLSDVEPLLEFSVFVTPHAERRLKSPSSRRRVPAELLCRDDELNALMEWTRRRLGEERNSSLSEYVFGIPRKGQILVPEDTVMRNLIPIIRRVTGDVTLRFHHLRHSFASLLYLKLSLGARGSTVPVLFPNQPLTQQFLEEGPALWQRLSASAGVRDDQILYLVSSLLGHSGPRISTYHYIHTMDRVLGLETQESPLGTSWRLLVRASGLPPATAYRRLQQGGAPKLLAPLVVSADEEIPVSGSAASELPETKAVPLRLEGSEVGADDVEGAGLDVLDRLSRALKLVVIFEFSIDNAARRWGFEAIEIEAALGAAGRLAARISRTGKTRHPLRHALEDWRAAGVPIPPVKSQDVLVKDQLSPAMIRLAGEEWDQWHDVFEYFEEHAWASHNLIVFKRLDQWRLAEKTLHFIRRLAVPVAQMYVVSFDTRDRSPCRAEWGRKLGIRGFGRIRPPNVNSESTREWIGIAPTFPVRCGELERSPAFRYLMTMAILYRAVLDARPLAGHSHGRSILDPLPAG